MEVENLEREAGVNRGWHGLRQRWVRPALIAGRGIAVFTQLSGIEMIIYYALAILTQNHFSTSAALLVSVGLGVTYLVMMIVGLSIVDHVGRRRLTLTMIPGAAIALAVLGVLFISGDTGRKAIGLIIVCLIVFMVFNADGLQLMGWLMGSEIYPLAVRLAGTSAQAATLWTTNLVITLSLLSILGGIGAGPTMWLSRPSTSPRGCSLAPDAVPLEYSIESLTCAVVGMLGAVMVGWPGAAQDRLPASSPGPRPSRPGVPHGPGEGCRTTGTPARERGVAPPRQPGRLRAGRPGLARRAGSAHTA